MRSRSIEFYDSFDLEMAAKLIADAEPNRNDLDAYGDAITALYFRIKTVGVSEPFLHSVLGHPDTVEIISDNESVHEYRWNDCYGDIPISSGARFLISHGMVVGLYKSDE